MNLRIGSQGDSVKFLQSSLNALIPSNPLKVDGIFGKLTDEKVRLYQRNKGLVVDGVVGVNTQKAISDDIKKLPNPQAILTDPEIGNKKPSNLVPLIILSVGLLYFIRK